MDHRKQILVNSVISFLQDELNGSSLNEEGKESIEVAIQCLETAFEVENQSNSEKVDLLSLINIKPTLQVTEEQKAEAEAHKGKGNYFMKTSKYDEAVTEYSKAIELNPCNAVYYCNRAAAYTRLLKDHDAINDCNEAIKLDPTYGKAYGRLGIAYSNLNKYDLAIKAYQTALKYDPMNSMYGTNLKVAEERLRTNMGNPAPSLDRTERLSQFINNPNIMNIASQIFNDPGFCNLMSGLINPTGSEGDNLSDAVETMLQAGQTLAQRVATEDPNFFNRVTNTIQSTSTQAGTNSSTSGSTPDEQPPEKKDQGPA